MYNLYEESPNILRLGRSIKTLVGKPSISEPLIEGDSPIDAFGASIYGSVIREGGTYRMWYEAAPDDFSGKDVVSVGYAESDDGLNWRKPDLNLVNYHGSKANNLVSLAMHCPSVFVDPTAPSSHRYRATGCCTPNYTFNDQPIQRSEPGYYTAHSSDGLNWEFDSEEPRWQQIDVITSCWDPFRNRGYVALKNVERTGGLHRRCIANAVLENGEYSDAELSLVADDYDDIRARESGGIAGDYYGMGWVPSEDLTFGMLWNYRIDAPISHTGAGFYLPTGLYGQVDLSLIWRPGGGGMWRHLPGRPTLLASGDPDTWYAGSLYTGSQSIRVGDEEWMYCCGAPWRHGDFHETNWAVLDSRLELTRQSGGYRIGVMCWKVGRLLGLHAPLYDELDIKLPDDCAQKQLRVNLRAWKKGCVRAEIISRHDHRIIEGYSREDCMALDGDEVNYAVVWKGQSSLPDTDEPLMLRLCLTRAAVYGFNLHLQNER